MSTVRFNTQFPGYEVLSELGRSNARVLKARHLDSGDLVAIKHFALNTDAETLRRFQRESAIMTSISHPNIVKVREVQLEAELPYIVMELIEGGNLHHLIKQQGHLDAPTTIRLGLQMASAFKAIHQQGIVHRDIKPENILYRPLPSGELHFLLTDFGVARLHEQSNTLTGQSLMTYEYASPEQFNDPKGISAATDYYSLGVVLYECLHGSVPFALADHSGIVTFMNKVLNDPPPALTLAQNDQAAGPFADLLQSLLKKNASERLSDPDELTWLLKQAELNYLQAGRKGNAVTRTATPPVRNEGIGEVPQPKAADVPQPQPAPVVTAPVSPRPLQTNRSGGGLKWVVLALVIVLAGAGIYVAVTGSGPKSGSALSAPAGVATTAEDPDSDAQPGIEEDDALNRRLAEEAQQREQLRLQALAAGEDLTVEVLDYKVGLFGGIKNLEIRLINPSSFAFPSVAVQVSYYKDSGGLYKTEKLFFNNVGPNSSPVRKAPDSDRGTRISCKVLKYDIPKDLDSLSRTGQLDALPDSTN